MTAPVRFLISGAAGQIGYSLIPLVATGQVLGPDQPVILHLLDIEPSQKVLQGVVMELEDCAYPLVKGIIATTDYEEAFTDVDYAVLLGGFPRRPGMTRADLLARNGPIFVGQGKAIGDYAKPTCKVLIVANPANTNCLTALRNSKLAPENFSCLTRLDLNRARGQISQQVKGASPKNLIIWGNHSADMWPDVSQATVEVEGKEQAVADVVDKEWLEKEFRPTVQKRGTAVMNARGLSSALSAANAAKDHMRDWALGTKEGEYVSMGVLSDGSYDVAEGLIFSFPVTCKDGKWSIVQDLTLDEATKAGIKRNETALLDERKIAAEHM